MLWELLVLVFLIWMAQRRWLMRKEIAFAKQLKTRLKSYPLIGHTYMLFGTDEDRMRSWEAFGRDAIKCGGVSKIQHFDRLLLCVADPAVAEVVLDQCLEKHDLMKLMHLVIGNASIIAPVPIWRHRRKIDLQTFKTKNLSQFIEIFAAGSTAVADRLEKEVGKGTFDVWEYTVAASINVSCETTMGVKINLQGSEVLHSVRELWSIASLIIMSQPWYKYEFVFQFMPRRKEMLEYKRILRDFITQIIREKQKLINEKSSHDGDTTDTASSFLDAQLETSEGSRKLSEEELIEETLLLVVAGYDTTSVTIAFFIMLMSRHPDVQEKVYAELQVVFGDSDRAITQESLSRLTYLEAGVRETLRLYPAVPIIGRHADRDVALPSGMTLVKGCGIAVNIWAINRHPAYWGDDADQFRPERFLDYTPKHPAAYVPFSYGTRGCIGSRYALLMLKTMSATLLRRYRVLAPPGAPLGEPLRTKFEMILRLDGDYKIQIERRK